MLFLTDLPDFNIFLCNTSSETNEIWTCKADTGIQIEVLQKGTLSWQLDSSKASEIIMFECLHKHSAYTQQPLLKVYFFLLLDSHSVPFHTFLFWHTHTLTHLSLSHCYFFSCYLVWLRCPHSFHGNVKKKKNSLTGVLPDGKSRQRRERKGAQHNHQPLNRWAISEPGLFKTLIKKW